MNIKIKKIGLGLTILMLVVLSWPLVAHSQGTGFTYNGRLNNNGAPVNGSYDMRFTIYDTSAGNNVIAGPLTITPVDVANGLFTVKVDFGAGVFTGPARWLNVEVQPTGGGGFAALTPRQEVTSSPYSIQALTAGSVVDGGVAANQLNTAGIAPTAGQILSYDGGNLFWTDPGVAAGNIWSLAGNNAFYNAGNVGIGTNIPAHRLSIAGGPNWTANLWKGALDLQYGAAMAFRGNAGTHYGIGSASGGLYFFHTASDPGTTASPTFFDMELADSGHLLIGGPSSDRVGVPLQVKGNLLVSPGGSGGEFQVGTPSGETGLTIIGNNRADVRFDGSTLKLLAGVGPGAMGSDNGINVDTTGKVGIGNTSPGDRLVVGGSVLADTKIEVNAGGDSYAALRIKNTAGSWLWQVTPSNDSPGGRLRLTDETTGHEWVSITHGGNFSVATLTIRGGADVAEPFELAKGNIVKGAVVVIDEAKPGQLKLSDQPYDTRVAGIVSGANGINPGIALHQEGVNEGGQNVALSGRVYVQADAAYGPIKPGDLLTTSRTPGYAMKVADHDRAQGAILGKAMSPLKQGRGMVLVLVTLQ